MTRKTTLAQEIRRQIDAGSIHPTRQIPSERQLANEFGVGRTVVQNALRELESDGLLVRQNNHRLMINRKSIQKQSNLDRKREQIAVWLLADQQDQGGMAILQEIRSVLAQNGLEVVLGACPSLDPAHIKQAESDFLRSLLSKETIGGAIVWATGSPDMSLIHRQLLEADIPVVFVDREPLGLSGVDVVSTNHRQGAKIAVRHLVDLGHRRIAMVANRETSISSVQDRIDGYRSVLAEAGLTASEDLFARIPPRPADLSISTEEILTRFMGLEEPPTAIFAVTDAIALHLLEVANKLGVKVPEQLSVVGFDWLMRWLPSGGTLSTVAQPFQEIGRVVAERLLDRIGVGHDSAPRHILIEAPLLVRSSTAPPLP